MYPFSYTGLRLIHEERVRDAMERSHIDKDLSRNSRQTARLSLPGAHMLARLIVPKRPRRRSRKAMTETTTC